MKNRTRTGIVLLVLAQGVAACGGKGSPSSVLGPTPLPPTNTNLRIVSGGDQKPVSGATVAIAGTSYTTDVSGIATIPFANAPGGAPLDVDAPGFLRRETSWGLDGTTIALWPVADQAEADAVRAMVYKRDSLQGEILKPSDPGEFYAILFNTRLVPNAVGAWVAEASAFGGRFGLSYQVWTYSPYETNELDVFFDNTAARCTPIPAWGFCRDPGPYTTFRVHPDRGTDPATIRRVLASWFLGPNPLPGFMNAQAPSDTLSPLELQTIRMILQRRRPNRWPDTDR